MKKAFVVDCGSYKRDLLLTVGLDPDRIIKEIENRSGESLLPYEKERFSIGPRTLARSHWLERLRFPVIQLKSFELTPRCLAVLAHEIFHSVVFLFDNIGIRLTDASDEAYAYQIEHVTERILRQLMSKDRRQDNAKAKRKKPKGSTG